MLQCLINFINCVRPEQTLKIAKFLQEERCLVSKFENEAFVRFSLLSLADNQHILIITLPSLYADSWTLNNLVKEISLSYALCLQDQDFSDEPVQYLQFSEWQNELLAEEDAKIGRGYWQKREFKSIESLKLPFELNNSKIYFQPDAYYLNLSKYLAEDITKFVTENHSNYHDFFLACWYILIWRLTKNSEIVIHNLYHGRKYEELHDTLGLLAKFLPLNCLIAQEFKFGEVLSYISEQHRQGEQYQEYFLDENIKNSYNNQGKSISIRLEARNRKNLIYCQ